MSFYEQFSHQADAWSAHVTDDVEFCVGPARQSDGPLVELAVGPGRSLEQLVDEAGRSTRTDRPR